jgi:hypothetical protein
MVDQLQRISEQLSKLGEPNWCFDLTSIGSLLTVLVISFYIYQYSKNNKRKKYEKALEYANIYAKEIIPAIGYILGIYKRANISEILHKIEQYDLVCFDQDELNRILSNEEQNKCKDAIYSVSINEFIAAREMYLGAPLPDVLEKINISELTSEKRTKIIRKYLLYEFEGIQCNSLNLLESMAMGFSLRVADREVVYSSLHQTFFRTIQVLYFTIASHNKTETDKFFTYVTDLYVSWRKKYKKSLMKKAKLSRKLSLPCKPLAG